ncbi:MAG TPA: Fe-S cluster assembly protein SufD [Xanthomonadaceae bacterium]|nr:Fe-S cluster assembly protein SufD [Xanthomonadaceae bacterium]
MSVLLESLAAAFDGDAAARATLDDALRDGLPPTRSEAWKYTPLRALERRSFAPAGAPPALDDALLAAIPAPRLVFVNGRPDPAQSRLAALPTGVRVRLLHETPAAPGGDYAGPDAVFARLNTALARDGLLLEVDSGAHLDAPLHLVFVGAPAEGDQAWHLRHRIALGRGARLALVEHHLAAGAHAHLANTLGRVELAEGARLLHARVQDEAERATLVARTEVALAAGARYARVDLELGAGLSRHELEVKLHGEGASLAADGVLLGSGRRHLDTRLGIAHLARDTACELLWRGLGAGRSRVVFHGGITIHPGADGSDANLSNKNLLLSDQAEIDSQPVLEIHADEVKAAHGATVGQLDPTAMFYLRSRGLPEAQARRTLTAAFCREAVLRVEEPALRQALADAVDRALARMENT